MTIYTKTTDFQAKDALASGNPLKIVKGTEIDDEFDAIAAADATNLKKDGTVAATGNIPMGTYKFTGLGSGSAATDSANLGQVQAGAYQLIGSISGTDTITGSLSPAISSYVAGQKFSFVSAGANAGAVTININSLGAKSITKLGTTALAAGDIPSGAIVEIEYDGTQFQLCNLVSQSTASVSSSAVLGSGVTATTQSAGDNSTKIATTAYADTAASNAITNANIGLTKLNSGTVSAAATLDIVMTSYTAYANKRLVFNLIPATDGVNLQMRVSTDGGSTYDSGASNYSYAGNTIDSATGAAVIAADNTVIVMSDTTVGNASNEGISGEIVMLNTTSTAYWPRFYYNTISVTSDATPRLDYVSGGGGRRAAQDTDAIRLLFSSGNIASGSWTLYGYN